MGWRSWNLFAGTNDDSTMRAMMAALVDTRLAVGGAPTSLRELGYLSVGMDDGCSLGSGLTWTPPGHTHT